MAEPISIAASVVTLVKTSRMVGSGITKLLALKHAPDILLALNNEVVDLEYLVVSGSLPLSKSSVDFGRLLPPDRLTGP